jgi:predicted lipoprotein with Yx(FWY)xxD motif
MKRALTAIAPLGLIAAFAIAGCGGGSDNGSSGSGGAYGSGGEQTATAKTTSSGSSATGTVAVVSASSSSKLGRIVVDSKGLTLYDFHKDKGTQSSCYGACEKVWPPLLTTGAPKAGEGAMASELGTSKRRDGTTQVTYAGHPLYTYEADTKPGDAKGNDIDSFGAEWYALQPSGEEAEG